jgi:hypothetical protein
MPSVAMSQFVGAIRNFEGIGNQNISRSSSDMQDTRVAALGHEFQPLSTAEMDQQHIAQIIDMAKDVQGIDHAYIADAFRGLQSGGTPITGREVAVLLKSAIHVLAEQLSFDDGERTLEEFAAFMDRTQLGDQTDLSALPADLARVDQEQAEAFVARHTRAQPAPAPSPLQPTPDLDNALGDLVGYKDNFGGSPNYPHGTPVLDVAPKTFFRIPYPVAQQFFNKHGEGRGPIAAFCRFMARRFSTTPFMPTPYEEKYCNIESMRLLAQHHNEIVRLLRSDPQQAVERLTSYHYVLHMEENGGPEGVIRMIDDYLELFTAQYWQAKDEGRLQDFFEHAVGGVCFPDRARTLAAYAMQHASDVGIENPEDLDIDPSHTTQAARLLSRRFPDVLESAIPWAEARAYLIETMGGQVYPADPNWPGDVEKPDGCVRILNDGQIHRISEEESNGGDDAKADIAHAYEQQREALLNELRDYLENVFMWEFTD